MAAIIPARPVTGVAIASAWGQSVHDRVYSPLASMASGQNMVGLTTNQRLSLDTHVNGINMLDAANNRLVIPVGGSGLYLINAVVQVANLVAATTFARCNLMINDVAQVAQIPLLGLGSSSSRNTMFATAILSDGSTVALDIYPVAADPADYMIRQLTLLRVGNGWGTSVLKGDVDTTMGPDVSGLQE